MTRVALVVLVSWCVAGLASAQVHKPAELFPPSVDFYAESAEPKVIVGIIEQVIRGTPWEDALAALHDRLDGKGTDEDGLWKGDPLPELTLFTSTEMRGELKKLGGFGFAYLGLNAKQAPRYAGVLLTGECRIADLAVRAWLTLTEGGWRRVDTVEKTVPVYQRRLPDPGFRGKDVKGKEPDQVWTPGGNEPTLAFLPGLIVIASDTTAVTEAVRRFRGTDVSPSLAGSAGYRERSATRPAAVLASLVAKPAKLLADYAAMRKADPRLPGAAFTAYLRFLVGVEHPSEFHAHLTMTRDALELVGTGKLGPSPLRPLLQQVAVNPAWGDRLPKDAPVRLSFRLPTGPTNRESLYAMLDAVASAQGRIGRKPSVVLQEWEALKPSAILGEVDGVGLAVDDESRIEWQLHLGVKRPLAERSAEVAALLKVLCGPNIAHGREEDAKEHVFTVAEKKTKLRIVVSAEAILVGHARPDAVPNAKTYDESGPFAATGTPIAGSLLLHRLLSERQRMFFRDDVPAAAPGRPAPSPNDNDPLLPLSTTLRDVVPPLEIRTAFVGDEWKLRLTIPNWHAALLRFFEAQTVPDDPDEDKPKAKEVPTERKEPVAPPPPPG